MQDKANNSATVTASHLKWGLKWKPRLTLAYYNTKSCWFPFYSSTVNYLQQCHGLNVSAAVAALQLWPLQPFELSNVRSTIAVLCCTFELSDCSWLDWCSSDSIMSDHPHRSHGIQYINFKGNQAFSEASETWTHPAGSWDFSCDWTISIKSFSVFTAQMKHS